ncbi:MAG: transcriptional regulator [Subdoligranulum variabile]|nr:MAG: transcriptional regulator [Subdoligranulum variabile]
MANEFSRILTLLRKERGITQKQAAQELGISQAQLSHYEKGIRECSLAFVVQVADYYDVSCDYLLGRSAERSGQTIRVEDLPGAGSSTSGSVYRGSVLPTMYKKLIGNSLDILYDKLQESGDKQLVTAVSRYLMLAVYKMFRQLHDASPRNVAGMFRVRGARWQAGADAAMRLTEADLTALLRGEDGTRPSSDPATRALTTERLTHDYPRHATSLLNLIKNAEEAMHDPSQGA